MKRKISLILGGILILALLAGCSSKGDKEIVISDGLFAEKNIVHHMVKMLIEDQTDIKVTIGDEMTPVNSYNEVVSGGADMMLTYDGTLLTTFLKKDPSDVPEGDTIYNFANNLATEQDKVYLLDKLGLNNTYAIAVPQEIAQEHQLETISDLREVSHQLVFGAEHEFFDEEGTIKFKPFADFYDIEFKEENSIDLNLKYSAVENGNLDVTVVYTTDGLNKKANLKVLEDDLGFFPEYNGAILVREDLFDRFEDVPELKDIINQLAGKFTNEIMTDLTYQVDVEGKDAKDVAENFLRENNLLN